MNIDEDCFRMPDAPQYQPFNTRMLHYVTELQSKPFEQIFIKNRKNKILAARVYRNDQQAPVDIFFHGWRGNAIRDFCGGARISFNMGHNVILVDQRGHGKSFGHTLTFGVKEKFDVLDWCNWAEKQFPGCSINLIGVSMGAATVVMSSGLKLPLSVKHIVADCPYSSPIEIIRKVCDVDYKISSKFLYPFLLGAAIIFGHFNLTDKKSTATYAVQHSKIPILLLHGDTDLFVPHQMSEQIQKANPELVKRELFPTAGHGLSYMVDTPRYEAVVKQFLEK